jgi:ABC-type antimicrobial peptide transport system permease subunit
MNSKALSYRDTFRTAFKHFTHSWKINLLIAIGTAIGLFSVIFFLGLGNGATKYMNDTITSSVNPNVVTIFKRTTTDNKLGNEQALQQTQQELGNAATNLDSTHLSKLKKVDNVKKVEPTYSISGLGTLTASDKSKSGLMTLDTWTQSNINDDYVAGSKPADGEIAIYASDAKELNKDYKSLVGKKITLKIPAKTAAGTSVEVTKEFTVSGILKNPQGPASSSSNLIATYNTVKAALESANADTDATYAVVTVNKVDNVKSTTSDIQDLKIDGTKAFVTYSVTSFLDIITNITNIVSYVLAAIAGISLIVSIFMIVVTTYMSVAERTKEIGVIRALGGRKKDISRLFTAESLILGLSSAAIAIGFAYLGQFLINKALSSFLDGASIVQISGGHIIFAIIVAVLIALLASLAPSGRAARLNTIEALASE